MRFKTACVALVTLAMGTGSALLAQDTYKVDPVHSTLLFRVKHLNVSYSYGRFDNPQGKIVWDAADPTKSSIEVSVKVADIDTDNAKRDEHLRGPDFFSAKEFPSLTFKSTSIKKVSENQYEVAGDLTIRGVTKQITVNLENTGSASNERFGTRTGFEGTFTINRQDYGVSYMPGGLGDDVRITVALEGVKE